MASELTFCSVFFDYNNDGYKDIYISNDKPTYINRLYKNNGNGTFHDVSVSRGAGIYINAMTTTIGDINTEQPWAYQVKARAKWDAWNSVKNYTIDVAMRMYVAEFEKQTQEFA